MKRALATLLILVASIPAAAQEMSIPAGLQARIFRKILLFDKAFERRAEGGLVVAVIYQNGFRRSYLAMHDFCSAATEEAVQPFDPVAFRCATVDLDRVPDLASALAELGADLLYVAPLRSYDIGKIARAAREMHLPAYTGVPDYLQDGLSVSLELREDKPRILINLKAAKESGAEFDSRILSLATIVSGGREGP
jgi:hypothetical protein